MTHEEIRKSMLETFKRIEDKANRAELFYVVCFWKTPITEKLDHRCAFFDSVSEALNFKEYIISTYKHYEFPYYVTSNLGFNDVNGGLL